ncbi:hypothetical protein MTO96_002081 [Rhipicephalus appendiculatus]
MATDAKTPRDPKEQDETRQLRREAGRGRSTRGNRSSCSLSDSISMEEPNEQSYIKEGSPDNTRIKVCHKRTQYNIDQFPEGSSHAPDPYEYSEEIVRHETKASTPGGAASAPAGGTTVKVANKNVQAGCVLCDPLREIDKPTNIIVEGVEPVRRSSMRSSDSATPESTGSSKKSVSFNIRTYRQMPKCVYCITIIVLGVVFFSPVIYLALASKGPPGRISRRINVSVTTFAANFRPKRNVITQAS